MDAAAGDGQVGLGHWPGAEDGDAGLEAGVDVVVKVCIRREEGADAGGSCLEHGRQVAEEGQGGVGVPTRWVVQALDRQGWRRVGRRGGRGQSGH